MSKPANYRMDKSAFSIQTFEEADDHYKNWADKSIEERLNAAWYLICTIFHVTPSTKLDRKVFSKRRHE